VFSFQTFFQTASGVERRSKRICIVRWWVQTGSTVRKEECATLPTAN